MAKFRASPQAYLEPSVPVEKPGVMYTCPMHPEVVSDQPGNCPKCGMALEPRNAPTEDNAELRDMTHRFWVSTALALPVFLIAMVSDLWPQAIPQSVSMTALQWIEFALATPAVLWGGWPTSPPATLSLWWWGLRWPLLRYGACGGRSRDWRMPSSTRWRC